MNLRRRIERVGERAHEWQAMRLAEELAPRSDRTVQELAAQALRDVHDLRALMREGLTLEEATRRFAEERGLDADLILSETAKILDQAGGGADSRVE